MRAVPVVTLQIDEGLLSDSSLPALFCEVASMNRIFPLCLFASVIVLFAGNYGVAEILPAPFAPDKALDSITVHFKGPLVVRPGLKPGARPQDDDACKLVGAYVSVGGTVIVLDWSKSKTIHDELLWWRIFRHGDLRHHQAEVTGTMIFKPLKEFGEFMPVQPGISRDTPVPVVIVESLKVQLVGPNGKPQGKQFDRLPAIAD